MLHRKRIIKKFGRYLVYNLHDIPAIGYSCLLLITRHRFGLTIHQYSRYAHGEPYKLRGEPIIIESRNILIFED